MDEEKIHLEIRLWALETLQALQFAANHKATPNPDESLEKMREQMLALAAKQTIPGLDAALSDHVAAEFEAQIERLLDLQKRWMNPRQE